MIATKKPIFEFAIKQKISKFDLNSVEGRVAAARAAAPVIAGIRDAALRPAYVRALAGWVSLDGNEIAALVDVALKQSRNEAVAELRRDVRAPEPPAMDPEAEPSLYPTIDLADPIMRFERQLLEVLLQVPNAYSVDELKRITGVAFSAPTHIAIANAIEAAAGWHGKTEFLPTVAGATPGELQGVLLEIAGQTLPANTDEQLLRYGQGVISRGLAAVLAREKNELLAALRRTDKETDPSTYAEIQRKLVALEAERRTVQG
jgi:DNA primase